MPIYKIKFINNDTTSGSVDYTLYSAPPAVRSERGPVQAWSNSFLTRSVPRTGTWSLAINGGPLAHCGTSSSRPLTAGVAVDITMSRAVTLGAQGSGSTLPMYNEGGYPAFKDESYTAPTGAYEIDTGADFSANLNWVAGYALSDGNGQVRPAATFEVFNNSRYTVAPAVAPKFYLTNMKSIPGSIIDNGQVPSFAEIDFAQHPGQYNAVVTRDAQGIYIVEFLTQSMFAMRAASSASTSEPSSVQLTQLKHQIDIMSKLINTALGEPEPATISVAKWACSFQWSQNPSVLFKRQICISMRNGMQKKGYNCTFQRISPDLMLYLEHPADQLKYTVWVDWYNSWNELPVYMKPYVTRPNVEKIFYTSDDSAAVTSLEIPDFTLPVIEPQYNCSLEWLEGPNERTKRHIADILKLEMERQEYYTFEPNIDEKTLVLPVWHMQPYDTDAVLAAWKEAIDILGLSMLGNYVTNPEVSPFIHTMNGDAAAATEANGQVNGQTTSMKPLKMKTAFVGYLTWLEGPSMQVKESIRDKMCESMAKTYDITQSVIGEERLEIFFTYDYSGITIMPIPSEDWRQAYEGLKFEKMYVIDPLCEKVPTYICELTWLEGPSPQAKTSIASKLVKQMSHIGYQWLGQSLGGPELQIVLSHAKPSSQEQALGDWITAKNTLGFQGMYVTGPSCRRIDVEVSISPLPVLDPGYACSIDWIEGPNAQTQMSIIGQLYRFMVRQEYTILSMRNNPGNFVLWCSHAKPSDLATATRDWLAACGSLGNQRMWITNPKCEPLMSIQASNVELSDIEPNDTTTAPMAVNDTSDSNGQGTQQVSDLPVVEALQVQPTASMARAETLEEKKRRALKLLEAEGLVGFGGPLTATA